MNRGYVLTPLAEADLDDIWDYVAERFGYDVADDVLESLHRALVRGRWKQGLTATDDPAVWVWAMLEHEEVDSGTWSQLRNIIRDSVHRETDATCWVYVRFRGASEST